MKKWRKIDNQHYNGYHVQKMQKEIEYRLNVDERIELLYQELVYALETKNINSKALRIMAG